MAQRRSVSDSDPALIIHADLILPWLNSTELASVSFSCKALHQKSKEITSRRSADASRSFERLPIPFLNAVDGQPYAYFIYTPTQIISPGFPADPPRFRQQWGSNSETRPVLVPGQPGSVLGLALEGASGCGCEKRCDGQSGCPCVAEDFSSPELTRECGLSCQCGSECGNRITQKGISVRLKIVKDRRKGWGLHADQFIRAGQFVCEYAGELLTTKEARIRQLMYDELASGSQFSSALLVVREHLPSGNACMRINIDATMIGNVARFINHSCDGGNLSTVLVRSSGAVLPRLCFFASRDIQEDEELTFSYGEIRLRPNGLPCFCGSFSCLGILPSEHT